jgi:hypothetical protein
MQLITLAVAVFALAAAVIAGDLPDPNITPSLADPEMTWKRLCSPGFTTYVTRNVRSARKKAIYKVWNGAERSAVSMRGRPSDRAWARRIKRSE